MYLYYNNIVYIFMKLCLNNYSSESKKLIVLTT